MAGGITNDPPIGWHAIHIIVENGNVTLVGVVDNDGDLALAEMRANGVSGVFSVTNELQVASKTKSSGQIPFLEQHASFLRTYLYGVQRLRR